MYGPNTCFSDFLYISVVSALEFIDETQRLCSVQVEGRQARDGRVVVGLLCIYALFPGCAFYIYDDLYCVDSVFSGHLKYFSVMINGNAWTQNFPLSYWSAITQVAARKEHVGPARRRSQRRLL